MEEEMTTRPTWLLELENRKRKPRLAHEAGAGAPCTNCKSACPGLDLHFWRKICKNCKCGRDDHDVDDAEFPQFDLLFGLSLGKFRNKSMRLQINNKKQNDDDETTFEWVPPNTTKELAVDYMKALPAEKLPIKGSVGAVLRRQLLQKQLPLHDVDHKVCDELSEQEQKQFEKYLENIKRYVGQGKVMKMFGARPFDRSLMTPVNATDMHKCSPQHKSHIPIFHSASVQLRTPSSFAARGPYARPPYDGQNKRDATTAATPNNEVQSGTKEYNCTIDTVLASSTIARSQPIEGNVICDTFHVPRENDKGKNGTMVTSSILTHLAEQEMVAARERHALGNYSPYGEDGETLNADTTLLPWGIAPPEAVDDKTTLAESMLADALLPPSAIHANDIVGSTLDEKGLTYIREKLAEKYNVAENPVARRAVFKSFRPSDASNVSPSPSPSPSPPLSPPLRSVESKDNDNPAGRTKYAEVTQYAAAARNPVEMAQMGVPLEARNEEKNVLKTQSQVVESTVVPAITDINEEKRCDLLSTTNDPLMTLTTSKAVMESTVSPLSSKRHHSPDSQKQKPVAARPCPLQIELSSLVLQPSVIHSEQLQNQVFPHVVGGQGNPEQYTQLTDCLKGTIDTFKLDSTKVTHECEKCQKCHEDIRIGDVVVTAEKATNAAWHPGCFVCSICNELLVDLVYFYYKNQLYCGRDLAAFLGIPRCFACDELIFVREYTVAEGHNYHVKHFCCWDCDMPLAGQQYITENDRPLCLPCYQKSYAKTCAACNVVIAADQQGVAIKNLNFHATQVCFCCYSCKKNLLNGRMAIKKDKLFCSKECIARFFNQ